MLIGSHKRLTAKPVINLGNYEIIAFAVDIYKRNVKILRVITIYNLNFKPSNQFKSLLKHKITN